MKKIFTSFLIIIISTFIITSIVSAATTISTEISTGGSLTVVGTSTLATTTFSGNVSIGTASQNISYPLDVVSQVFNSGIILGSNYTDTAAGGYILLRKARGTLSVPSSLLNGDQIASILGQGYNGSAFSGNIGEIGIKAAETFTATSTGTYIVFGTTALGATTRAERMRITPTGNVGIGISAPTSQFQVASSSATATTSIEIGKAGGQKSCLVLYDAGGSVVYAYVQAGATTFTLSTTSCK